MIIGIMALTAGVASAASGADLTALLDLNFVTAEYYSSGSSVAIASIIDLPARVAPQGLAVVRSAPVTFTGAAATVMLSANWTVIIDYVVEAGNDTAPFGQVNLLELNEVTLNDVLLIVVDFLYLELIDEHNIFDANPVVDRDLFSDDPVATQDVPARLAVTRTVSELAASANGGAVMSDQTDLVGIQLTTCKGAYHTGSGTETVGHIRRLRFISPVIDANLPGLSS